MVPCLPYMHKLLTSENLTTKRDDNSSDLNPRIDVMMEIGVMHKKSREREIVYIFMRFRRGLMDGSRHTYDDFFFRIYLERFESALDFLTEMGINYLQGWR